jgi:hypothetical protein
VAKSSKGTWLKANRYFAEQNSRGKGEGGRKEGKGGGGYSGVELRSYRREQLGGMIPVIGDADVVGVGHQRVGNLMG